MYTLRKIFFAAVEFASSLSRQVVVLFFLAIGATVAGGLYTALRSPTPGTLADGEDPGGQMRFPSSVKAGSVIGGVRAGISGRAPSRNFDSSSSPISANRDDVTPATASNGEAPPPPIPVIQNPPSQAPPALPTLPLAGLPTAGTGTSTSTGTNTNTNPFGQFGGSVNGTNTSTSTGTATSVATSFPNASTMALTGTSAGWTLTCQKLTLTFLASNGMTMPTTMAYTVSFAASAGTVYSDAACTSPLTSLAVAAESFSGTVYFADTAPATDTITASEPTLGNASFTVTVGEAAASLAIGQASLTASGANNGGVSAAVVSSPGDVLVVGNQLFVADPGNNRVLGWNSLPTSSGQAADFVVGQPDFTTVALNSGGAASGFTLRAPAGLASDGTRLFVADTGNSRVLVWNTLPSSTHVSADVALGQPNLGSDTSNQGGIAGAGTLASPPCVTVSGGKLFVCDAGNNRVLVWNSIPAASGVAANFAIGQPDTATVTVGDTAIKMGAPKSILISGTRLYVTDNTNNRVMAWNTIPTASGATADFALGQINLTSNATAATATGLSGPVGISLDSQGRLFVGDTGNNRVLIWNSEPSSSGAAAAAVIGQPNLTGQLSNSGGLSATSTDAPSYVHASGSQLWVSDTANSRVLEYSLP